MKAQPLYSVILTRAVVVVERGGTGRMTAGSAYAFTDSAVDALRLLHTPQNTPGITASSSFFPRNKQNRKKKTASAPPTPLCVHFFVPRRIKSTPKWLLSTSQINTFKLACLYNRFSFLLAVIITGREREKKLISLKTIGSQILFGR